MESQKILGSRWNAKFSFGSSCIFSNINWKTYRNRLSNFALSAVFAFITMYDAAGVRRAVGEQAQILNKVVKEYKDMTPGQILQEKKQGIHQCK